MDKSKARVGMAVIYQHRDDGPTYRGAIVSTQDLYDSVSASVLVEWATESKGRTWIPCRFLTECCLGAP